MDIDGASLAMILVAIPVLINTLFDGLAKVIRACRGEPDDKKCKKEKHDSSA